MARARKPRVDSDDVGGGEMPPLSRPTLAQYLRELDEVTRWMLKPESELRRAFTEAFIRDHLESRARAAQALADGAPAAQVLRLLNLRDPGRSHRGPSYPFRMLVRFQDLVLAGKSKLDAYATLRREFKGTSAYAVSQWLKRRRAELELELARVEQLLADARHHELKPDKLQPNTWERTLRRVLEDLKDLPDPRHGTAR